MFIKLYIKQGAGSFLQALDDGSSIMYISRSTVTQMQNEGIARQSFDENRCQNLMHVE